MRERAVNSSVGGSTFNVRGRTWVSAFLVATLIEGALAAFILLSGYGVLSVPIFRGADNPLFFFVAFLLQFPASVLFVPLFGLASSLTTDEELAMLEAFTVVAVLQTIMFAVLLRKPWRKDVIRG
jgi:ABC-type glycerol-3-phosphate transport system permease component